MFGTRDKVEQIVEDLSTETDMPVGAYVDGQQVADHLRAENLTSAEGPERIRALLESVQKMNSTYEMHYYHEMSSSVPVLGRIVVLFKKVIRRGLLFLMQPMVEEQNAYHMAVTQSMNEVYKVLNDVEDVWRVMQLEQEKRMELQEKVDRLERKLRDCEKQMEASKQ